MRISDLLKRIEDQELDDLESVTSSDLRADQRQMTRALQPFLVTTRGARSALVIPLSSLSDDPDWDQVTEGFVTRMRMLRNLPAYDESVADELKALQELRESEGYIEEPA